MKKSDVNSDSLDRFFNLATKHFYRMNKASQKIQGIFVCSDDEYDDQVDILTSRFQALQSVMAEKLIPTSLELLGENGFEIPFREMIDRAIKLDIVNVEFEEWDAIRNERNKISHGDYDELTKEEQKVIIKHFQSDEVKSINEIFLHLAGYILESNYLSPHISTEHREYFLEITSGAEGVLNAHQKQ
jgi:hypothetical protein